MIPESFKPGMMIYINLHSIGVVNEYKYEGDGIFESSAGKVDLSDRNWEDMFYSFSEEHAECKSYLYKLNQYKEQLGIETRKVLSTQSKIDTLNERNLYLKEKYPEEFI